MKNKDIYNIEITDTNENGKGIAKKDGLVIFIDGLVTGDVADIEIISEKKNYSVGKVKRVHSPSPYRITPICRDFRKCGGCTLSHVTFDFENEIKRNSVRAAFRRNALSYDIIEPTLSASERTGYRNKISLRYCADTCTFGYSMPETNNILPFNGCALCSDDFNKIVFLTNQNIDLIKSFFPEALFIRSSSSGDIVISILSAKKITENIKKAYTKLSKNSVPKVSDIVFLTNDKENNEKAYIFDDFMGLKLRVDSNSFRQVNKAAFEILLREVVKIEKSIKFTKAADLYCGSGVIGLISAREFPSVHFIGTEINRDSIENAKSNAALNSISNINFFCGDSASFSEKLHKDELPDLIIVDPPRFGLSDKMKKELLAMFPENIIYISCNPQTLARDVAELNKKGYEIKKNVTVNLFPMTRHVETVVLLSRETNPLTVEVRMEVETGEIKEHPTYKRIQEYVQEKYGFKVHTAYIAEVKRMVGLDMHKAPNAVEQRKHEYHPCPPEKVEAIKDALRHFGLIAE